MDLALALARAGLGRTAPNPSVGCVIVTNGRVTGAARTADSGRPHAETQALAQAGDSARGATAYVTLEPCAHHGVTPPCAEALIAAGISRCVVALTDPDPRVAGGGLKRLRESGIDTVTGVREAEGRAVNAAFLKRLETGHVWLGIDDEAGSYDQTLDTAPDGLEAALAGLAREGALRVRLEPGSDLARQAEALGLADFLSRAS